MNFIEIISEKYATLSRTEKKVAQVIISEPQKAIHTSIAALAKQAGVSEPSVHRFCQKVNTKGFPDFKLRLAQSLGKGINASALEINENDSAESYTKKIFDASISTLSEAKKNMDVQVIQRCVDALSCARRITFCGLGNSAAVAHDMMNKFVRFNMPCNYFEDPIMMLMNASNCGIEDVFVMISKSGRTSGVVETAKLAQAHRATVIGITSKDTPLAENCNLVLSMKLPSETDIYMPISSRLAQLALADVLATGFILRKGPHFIERLRATAESIRENNLLVNTKPHTESKTQNTDKNEDKVAS